ncbi:MAG: spore germination protein GerW family protein [Dehalococcoidia bacterium]
MSSEWPATTTEMGSRGLQQNDSTQMRRDDRLSERLLRPLRRLASTEAVYGQPLTAHGRTVIPVARTYFVFGAGGGWGEGNAGKQEPDRGRGTGEGGGGGGAGWTVASGYIELSPEGTRYVAFSDRNGRVLGAVGGLLLGLALTRFWRRR